VTEADRDAAASEEHPRGHVPELEQPYDQIINSTDYLELINAVEHGHVVLKLTVQGAIHFLLCRCMFNVYFGSKVYTYIMCQHQVLL